MSSKKELSTRTLLRRPVRLIVIAGLCMGLVGCNNKQLARIEQNQLTLKSMIQGNTDRTEVLTTCIEQNHHQLLAQIENVQNETLKVADDIAVVGNEQKKLQEQVQNNNHQLGEKLITVMEENSQRLQAGIEKVWDDTLKVAANVDALRQEQNKFRQTIQNNNQQLTEKVVAVIEENQQELLEGFTSLKSSNTQITAHVTDLGQEQIKLAKALQQNNKQIADRIVAVEQNQQIQQTGIESLKSQTGQITNLLTAFEDEQRSQSEAFQNNNQQLIERVASIEQNQQQDQKTFEGFQVSVRQVSDSIDNLGQNVSQLQEALQNDLLEMVKQTNTRQTEQSKFQEQLQKDLQTLVDSVNVMKQRQDQFRQQIEFVQRNTETLSNDIPAAIEQLKEEVSNKETAHSAE